MRYFDVNQNPVMINQEGMVYRLETDNMLVHESANYQLSGEAIELTEVSFLRRFHDRLAHAFIRSLDPHPITHADNE